MMDFVRELKDAVEEFEDHIANGAADLAHGALGKINDAVLAMSNHAHGLLRSLQDSPPAE